MCALLGGLEEGSFDMPSEEIGCVGEGVGAEKGEEFGVERTLLRLKYVRWSASRLKP